MRGIQDRKCNPITNRQLTDKRNPYRLKMNNNQPTKQTKVAIAVLKGATIPDTAKKYSISKIDCQKKVNLYCARSDRPLYDTLQNYYGDFNVPLHRLRKHADTFIKKSRLKSNGETIPITVKSSIWDLSDDVPILTLNALWDMKIATVGELLQYNEKGLLRLKKIGKIGVQKLVVELNRHGLELKK